MPVGELTVTNTLESELALYTDDDVGLFYAPFDHLEAQARIAIVGVTPGPTQAFAAIRSGRAALEAGHGDASAQAAVKRFASFKGMRAELVSSFDALGLSDLLGLGSCAELFGDHPSDLIHTTSAVRYPTFRRTGTGWQPWNGYRISPLEHPVLRGMIVGALGPELAPSTTR
jgi:hypothetical protein